MARFSSLDLCESEIPMLILQQYKNIGRIITFYIVSAVLGLIFMRTLASNLILQETFFNFFQIGSTNLGFYQVASCNNGRM